MTEDRPGAPGPEEPVGSVGEEAAKLLGALSLWAREQRGAPQDAPADGPGRGSGSPWEDLLDAAAEAAGAATHAEDGDPRAAAGRARGAARDTWARVEEHLAAGPAECRWCPLCQVVATVRATSPEVKAHLATAAGSLAQAVAAALATQVPEDARRPRGPVEHIDLDGEPDAGPGGTGPGGDGAGGDGAGGDGPA